MTTAPVPQFLHLRAEDGDDAERVNTLVRVKRSAASGPAPEPDSYLLLFASSPKAPRFNGHEQTVQHFCALKKPVVLC